MNRMIVNLIATLFICGLLACGGAKKVLISQNDIDQANNKGTLEALYEKAGNLAAESRGAAKEDLTQTRSIIAKLLVQHHLSQVNSRMTQAKTEFGLVDRATLIELNSYIANIQQWDLQSYQSIATKIQQALDNTNRQVDLVIKNSETNHSDVAERMKWMKKAAILSGKGQPEEINYGHELSKNIQQLSANGRDAFKKRMYNIAIQSAQAGLKIDPGNIQFESLISQSEAALFEQEFRAALENGKPELAYKAFIEVSDKPIMRQLRKKMQRNILLLANYFASNAQSSYQDNDFFTAYIEFNRGRDIQEKLSLTTRGFIQEKRYLDLLMQRFEALPDSIGQKFALLSVIKEFDPAYPSLEENMAKALEIISNRAMTKLSVSEFKEALSSNSVAASVGRRVASKLEKILFEKLGNELQIVTDIANVAQNDFSGVVLAIKGEVLQAAIETIKNQGQRSVNVQTGIKKIETTEYTKWKKRKKGVAPTQFNEQKIMEDITIHLERIRKLAVVEVAYRIVEPSTQKVLLTNNLVKEANHQGDSISEFQKGMFHQAYVDTNLPSDIKIMDNLATQLSVDLGQTLLNYLANPEKVFYQKYQQAIDRGDKSVAIEMLSNAVVLADKKGQSNIDWLTVLKRHGLETK